jgi:beta-lactamase class A
MTPYTKTRRKALSRLALAVAFAVGASLRATAAEDILNDALRALIREAGAEAHVAVAFHDLESGHEAVINADEPFHPASTIKVPVMMEVYRQFAAGTLSPSDKLPVRNEFTSIADGTKYTLDPKDDSELSLYKRIGEDATIDGLVRLMITESSNLATNLLVDRVKPGRVTDLMRRLGADGVVLLRGVEDRPAYARGMNNQATARGLALILRRLAEGKVVSQEASDAMLGVLRDQKFNEGIPAGLPKGVPVAHKTGSFAGVYHDVAVVEPAGRKPYVLVVLTRGIADEARAHRLVSEIARAVHGHLPKR